MKKIITFLLLCLSIAGSKAQTNKIDSLKLVLQKEKQDTTGVLLLSDLMLFILIGIGALLVPLHHRLEKWITEIMVEKNKKIRLDAAKRTIATLEGE